MGGGRVEGGEEGWGVVGQSMEREGVGGSLTLVFVLRRIGAGMGGGSQH